MRGQLKEVLENVCGLTGAVLQLILFLVILVGLCVLGSCAVWQVCFKKSITEILNESWALSPALPSDVRCEYEYSNSGFDGGEHFYAFDWEGHDDSVFSAFHAEKSTEFEEACEGMLLEYVSTIDESVPDDYRPDWSESYRWQYKWRSGSEGEIMDAPIFGYDDYFELKGKDADLLYMVYFPAAERLCIVDIAML